MLLAKPASTTEPEVQHRPGTAGEGRGKTVLVVDDDPDARDFIYWTLFPLGYDVTQAESGPECLEKMASRRFDLLLLDLRMPGMEGMEVLERVRSHHPRTCVILISAYADWPDYFEAVSKGARDVIPKPLSCKELIRVVWSALSGGEPPANGSGGSDHPSSPRGSTDDRPSAAT